MDMAVAFSNINWLSVLAAAVSSFLVGGLWYGPLFGKAWMNAFGFTEEELAGRNMPMVFGGALALALIASINLEMFIGAQANVGFGATAGFFTGFGWVSMSLGILYLFENRSMKAYLIDAGYCTVALTLMGVVLGIW
jgi:hypothetical protein